VKGQGGNSPIEEPSREEPTLGRVGHNAHVDARRAGLFEELKLEDVKVGDRRSVEDEDQARHGRDGDYRVARTAQGHGGYRVDDGQVAIERHEDEGIDADVGGHVNGVLVDLDRFKCLKKD